MPAVNGRVLRLIESRADCGRGSELIGVASGAATLSTAKASGAAGIWLIERAVGERVQPDFDDRKLGGAHDNAETAHLRQSGK